MRVFIIGLPGVGKSTFGAELANHLSIDFVDLDTRIEAKLGGTIAACFETEGEAYFRKVESQVLFDVIGQQSTGVVATGGGTCAYGNNMQTMLDNGVVVLLKDTEEAIADRIAIQPHVRPMFLGLDKPEIAKKLKDLWDKRKTYYEQTHIITGVDAIQKPQLLTKRLELFTKKGKSLNDIIEID